MRAGYSALFGEHVMIRTGLLSVVAMGGGVQAATPTFKQHAINEKSPYEACGVFDVNGDGRLDIVSGAYWYEAPDWKRHDVRPLKEMDGYYPDFSTLPVDVNGDGYTDFLSCTWHTKEVCWIENPSGKGGQWVHHSIDTPGNMETAFLADVDADGKQDMLPNCMSQVVWYSLKKAGSPGGEPAWEIHHLGRSGAGHGVGFGDVNGDSRKDVLGPRGWLEAPTDRKQGEWNWHPEWELQDASIEIVVLDVDGDGDSDIVWGRGHNYGVYWLEQTGKPGSGPEAWRKHEIDKSWSQAHAVLAADIDGDGELEVVTGKRYRAHNGHDPGSGDPLCGYYYKYDRAKKRWQRHKIWEGGRCGLGLSSVVIDIDGDGDLDIVAAGKSGLYLLESQLSKRAASLVPRAGAQNPRGG